MAMQVIFFMFDFKWMVFGGVARFLKVCIPDLILLVSLHESELHEAGVVKSLIYKYVLSGADSVYVIGESGTESPLLASIPQALRHPGNAKSLMNLVHHTYADLLNRREKKLSRAK